MITVSKLEAAWEFHKKELKTSIQRLYKSGDNEQINLSNRLKIIETINRKQSQIKLRGLGENLTEQEEAEIRTFMLNKYIPFFGQFIREGFID